MGRQAQTVAPGGVAVQIDGDHNAVAITLAGATLRLDRLHTRKADPTTPIELLRTDVRATTFIGRAAELEQLATWRAAPQRISVRCLTAGAGTGKTRLAIEACEEAEAEGWIGAFVSNTELARFHATQNLVHWVLPLDAFLVIDSAATSLFLLKEWLACLAPERDRQDGGKLRILLLERQADPEEGWWSELTRRESGDRAGPADLIGKNGLRILPTLEAVGDRRALLAQAMRRAAPLLDPPAAVQQPPPPEADPWFDARLADNRTANEPLYLMMAGVHAARHGAPTALTLDRVELAGEMAGIEASRLEAFARARGFTDNGSLLKHLAACVTLQNGCDIVALPTLVREEMSALALSAPFHDTAVADRLCDCLLVTGGKAEPLRPNLIGESFLLPIMNGGRFRGLHERLGIVMRAYQRASVGTIYTLIHCAQDLADGHADHAAVHWLEAIVEASGDLFELMRIANSLPDNTLALRELAADVNGRVTALLRAEADQKPNTFTLDLARSLNNLAKSLNDLGRREEALAAAEEAVRRCRILAAAWPNSFTQDLATLLSNLANVLGALGRPEDALTAVEEAVRHYHALAATFPNVFTPYLAMSLNNYALFLNALGRPEDALAAAEEAVRRYHALATAQPDAFTPDLAMSLNNLALFLSDLGRPEEALAAAEEAVRRYHTLAAACPDAFTPDLAGSLANLAKFLSALGRHDGAFAAAGEAVRLRRTLATTRPDVFTPDLAASLTNLTSVLNALGRREEALAAVEEAVHLRLALASIQPDVFSPDLAASQNNLAKVLNALGRHEGALAAAEEAVRLRRTLAAARPDDFTPDLARSLSVLGNVFEALGRDHDAIASDEEAVFLLRPYFLRHPAAFADAILASARDYIRRCELSGREADGALLNPIADVLSSLSSAVQ